MTALCSLHIIWLFTILASTFCEAFTEKSIAIWGAPAAAISLIVGIFGLSARSQIITFFISLAVMILAAQFIKRIIGRSRE